MEMNNMNMNWGNQRNQFEEPADKSLEQVFGSMSLGEISSQLFAQGPKYKGVIDGLDAGNLSSIGEAENLKKILASFINRLHKESKATAEGKRLSDIIEERIRTLDGLLQTPKTSH